MKGKRWRKENRRNAFSVSCIQCFTFVPSMFHFFDVLRVSCFVFRVFSVRAFSVSCFSLADLVFMLVLCRWRDYGICHTKKLFSDLSHCRQFWIFEILVWPFIGAQRSSHVATYRRGWSTSIPGNRCTAVSTKEANEKMNGIIARLWGARSRLYRR